MSGASTTARRDVEDATALARDIEGVYGTSYQMGRMHWSTTRRATSPVTARRSRRWHPTLGEFDDEVRRLVPAAEHRATQVLSHHASHLERMVSALEVEETPGGTGRGGPPRPRGTGKHAGAGATGNGG